MLATYAKHLQQVLAIRNALLIHEHCALATRCRFLKRIANTCTGLLRVLEILECTWFLQWQFPGLESTWKWKKVLENSWKNKNSLTKALYLQKSTLSLVIRSVRQAFPSFFLRNLEIQQLLHTYRTVKVLVSTPCVYYTDITFVLGKIKFVLKNSWISPGKIINLLCMNPDVYKTLFWYLKRFNVLNDLLIKKNALLIFQNAPKVFKKAF